MQKKKIPYYALKAMCHTDVEAPMVTNWFPYFLPTSLLFGSIFSKKTKKKYEHWIVLNFNINPCHTELLGNKWSLYPFFLLLIE